MEQNLRRQPRTGFVTDPAAGIEVTLSLIFELLKITDSAFRHGAGRGAIYKLYSFKFFVKCAIATLFSGYLSPGRYERRTELVIEWSRLMRRFHHRTLPKTAPEVA